MEVAFLQQNGTLQHNHVAPDERGMQTETHNYECDICQEYYSRFLNEDISSNQDKLQFIVGHGILRPDIRWEFKLQKLDDWIADNFVTIMSIGCFFLYLENSSRFLKFWKIYGYSVR